MRRIPATIGTQHPDNSVAPYWDKVKDPFVAAYKETEEAFSNFSDLGIEEYMWDWEGKNADASVVDKLLTKYYAYFSEHKLGKDKFLTFRVPNIWEEKGYSLLQAMTVILSSEDFARDLDFEQRPLFEIILPMTATADQLMHLHRLFNKFSKFKSSEFTPDRKANTKGIEVIPLVEEAASQRNIGKLLAEYVAKHQTEYGKKPEYIRVFLACSDPALTEGFITTKLSNKLALSEIAEVEKTTGVVMHPFAGPGSLPFRGGFAPDTVEDFVEDFAGLRTITLQSAFRYDYPKEQVVQAVEFLNKNLAKTKTDQVSVKQKIILDKIADAASDIYKQTLAQIGPEMKTLFDAVPKRRERRQHVGLLAYKRSSAGLSLPRAITFTAGFYSIGIPPEFIGSGRTLAKLSTSELDLVKKFSKTMINDFIRAGKYLNKKNLHQLAQDSPGWNDLKTDIETLEELLGVQFGPKSKDEIKHSKLTEQALKQKHNSSKLSDIINKTAKLRRSLG